MSKFKLLFLSSVCTLFIVGCGSQGAEDVGIGACENPLIPIEVDFSWDPEIVHSGEVVVFQAVVTHDNISVANANEVKFEIWEHANPDYHFMEDTINEGEGLYTLEWTFPDEGVYYAYYHVTACDMHRMEKKMVVVGDVDVDQITAEPDTVKGKMSHDFHGGSEHSDDQEHVEAHEDEHHDEVNHEQENKHNH